MSKCMAIADEAIDQTDTCTEITAKSIVENILEEILHSAAIISDKSCSRIGDFNVTEDFCQQFDQVPAYSKEFEKEKINSSQKQSGPTQDVNLDSGEIIDHFVSLLMARENLELILESTLSKKDEKSGCFKECTVLNEDTLADGELRIENGQIHLERNKSKETSKNVEDDAFLRSEYEEEIKDEPESYDGLREKSLNKIHKSSLPDIKEDKDLESVSEVSALDDKEEQKQKEDEADASFKPFTTEMLRQSILQVWGNVKPPAAGRYDGDMSAQADEIVRLMEELSNVQLCPESRVDPNRPRACAFAEEDVKKMIKEIAEINFNQSYTPSEETDTSYHPDGQGDADLESKSFAKSRDGVEKSLKSLNESINKELSTWDEKEQKEHVNFFTCFENDDEEMEESLPGPMCFNERKVDELQDVAGYSEDTQKSGKEIPSDSKIRDENESPYSKDCSFSVIPLGDEIVSREEVNVRHSLESPNSNKVSQDFGGLLHNTVLNSEKNESVEKKSSELLTTVGEDHTLNPKTCGESIGRSQSGSNKQVELVEKVSSLLSETDLDSLKGSLSPNNASDSGSQPQIVFPDENKKKSQNSERETEIFSIDFLDKITDKSRSKNNITDNPNGLDGPLQTLQTNLDVGSTGSLRNRREDLREDLKSLGSASGKKEDSASDRIKVEAISSDEKRGRKVVEKRENTSKRFPYISYGSEYFSMETFPPENTFLGGQIYDSLEESLSGGQETDTSFGDMEEVIVEYGYQTHAMTMSEEGVTNRSSGNEIKLEESSSNGELTPDNEKSEEQISGNPQEQKDESDTFEPELNEVSSTHLPKKLMLQSQKTYLVVERDPGGNNSSELKLTDSEEALIDLTENVLQVIEPSTDTSRKISFSLFDEVKGIDMDEDESNSCLSVDDENGLRERERMRERKMYSGMTTIGPMKNIDHDPKDLTAPEIDFGKMRRITSSRQLAKDIFCAELNVAAASSVKILEEEDSDSETTAIDGDRLDIGSLVNRDIASLTKVQKVREVMSYHPKLEEDFEEEENLTRTRLDLKDVESMTDERYKIPDMTIPLLSFEVGDSTPETDKDFLENVNIVLSRNRFENSAFFHSDVEDADILATENTYVKLTDSLKNESIPSAQDSFLDIKEQERNSMVDVLNEDKNDRRRSSEVVLSDDKEAPEEVEGAGKESKGNATKLPASERDGNTASEKYGTLGSVFRKASNKLIRRENDPYLRNTKSLPRDTSKLTASSSLRSILDDCHNSATNVLKKSRSLLKNTQIIFKTLSQTRFNDPEPPKSSDKEKSESNILDSRGENLAFVLKKRMEKTFKSSSTIKSGSTNDLRVASRNEDDFRQDRLENLKKIAPKSPLVYKSQFVKSQISVRGTAIENKTSEPAEKEQNKEQNRTDDGAPGHKTSETECAEESVVLCEADSEKEVEIPFEEKFGKEKMEEKKLTWLCDEVDLQEVKESGERNEQQQNQPEYIVMETVEGLPNEEFEVPTFEVGVQKTAVPQRVFSNVKLESITSVPEISDEALPRTLPVTLGTNESVLENSPRLSEREEDKEDKESGRVFSERKIRKKNKNLSARFRSFWCSAFGKVKSSPKKKDAC